MLQEVNLVAQHFPKDTNRRTSVDLRRCALSLSATLAQAVKEDLSKPQLLEKLKIIDSNINEVQDAILKLSNIGLVDKVTCSQINGEIDRLKDDVKGIRTQLTFGV